ncbi:MAG: MFS transporter, partial [Pelagibacterales bacterium]|nr:MFS transporter [Pelagibacterales bacterium]
MRNIFLTFLALSLSFVGIPIYVNISDFYARKFGISLIVIGLVLAIVRFIDSIQDPFIGKLSDNLSQKNISRKITISISGIFLCLFFYFVFNPPQNISQNLAILWFIVTLSATYFCFNFIFINFESIIAINSKNDQERVILNSFKEFFGILGMILAFTIPTILAKYYESEKVYQNFSLIFVFLLIIGL